MLSDLQQESLLNTIDAMADAPRRPETLAEIVFDLAGRIDAKHLPAYLNRLRNLARYPGHGGLIAEYIAVAEANQEEPDYSRPVCLGCGDTGWRSIERNGLAFAERCDHREGKGKPSPRIGRPDMSGTFADSNRVMTDAEFAERAAL